MNALPRRRAVSVAGVALLVCSTLSLVTAPGGRADTTCNWPMFGYDSGRSFSTDCSTITPATAATLKPKWFFNTSAPVTAQPAVFKDIVYAGAFDGKFFALHASDGTSAWPAPFDAKHGSVTDNEKVDYGVFPDSPAVATIGNGSPEHPFRDVVVIGGGATLFVLDAKYGTLLAHQCVDVVDSSCQGTTTKSTQIEGSPNLVPDGKGNGGLHVIFGMDHNEADPSGPGGVISLKLNSVATSAAPTGVTLDPEWWFNPETGSTTTGSLATAETDHGCGDVWSSPTVDQPNGLVFFGTGNCNNPSNVNQTPAQVESTFAIGLEDGLLKWQATPHAVGNGKDLDFGATPNLLDGGLVGEGGKDGVYYAYARESTGNPSPIWQLQVATPSSIGGMIPSTAVGHLGPLHCGDAAIFADTAIPISSNDPQGSVTNDAMHPNQAFGVHAVDTATGKIGVAWDAPVGPSYGAAVYSGGVVFVPDTFTDSMLALDADTGTVLRNEPLDAPPSSPAAVAGDSVYIGAGTTENNPPLNAIASLGGIWAFQTTVAGPGLRPPTLPACNFPPPPLP